MATGKAGWECSSPASLPKSPGAGAIAWPRRPDRPVILGEPIRDERQVDTSDRWLRVAEDLEARVCALAVSPR